MTDRMKIIEHEQSHGAKWISYGRPRKYPKGHTQNPFGNPIRFRCPVRDCEVNHGNYDCPICKSNGKKRVMDEQEKQDGICGDCGLEMDFRQGKLGNGLLIAK